MLKPAPAVVFVLESVPRKQRPERKNKYTPSTRRNVLSVGRVLNLANLTPSRLLSNTNIKYETKKVEE
jgi:hypothetical protein